MLALLGLSASGEKRAATSQVYGAYGPSDGQIDIADDGPTSGPLFELNLAHELVHALDDQHFGLPDTEGMTDDAALAAMGPPSQLAPHAR